MISRTYICLLPAGSGEGAGSLDVFIRDDPGTIDDPVSQNAGTSGYYEVLGRPVRFETIVGDTGFVPRFRLGYSITLSPLSSSEATGVPGMQLSESLVGDLSSLETGGPLINIAVFSDPGGLPAIRLTPGTNTGTTYWQMTLMIVEPKDVDRQGTAGP